MCDYQKEENPYGLTVVFDLRDFLLPYDVITIIKDIKINANIGRVILFSEHNELLTRDFVININTSLNQAKVDFNVCCKRNFSLDCLERDISHYLSEYDLSPRVATVRKLISQGFSVHEISKIMRVKDKTVYSYINTLKGVYNIKNLSYLYFHLQRKSSLAFVNNI